MTTTVLPVVLGCLVGLLLGLLHFGGLWLTLQYLPTARRPWLVTLGSAVARLGMSLVGFYVVLRLGWQALAVSLMGFLGLRVLLMRRIRTRHLPSERVDTVHGG